MFISDTLANTTTQLFFCNHQYCISQDMPNDNDNEGPGLGLGDLNDIFNDDPFSNAGGESPTGNHRLIISDNAPLLVIY